ncbi:ShlB/FhaC/HecB family hemolysin secretion/activation protein [Plastoroseomonas arctica]|uniref:ShlB/FhaC/HecB family hemolysin secretion/activation protein n=1 Tax=Plastoroseomonas arctica TaxID=1509237 RepID=A0AAF1KI28_9PROT|nr:ShlB/FhaC/HecB family hemolysin secretion/activation protein [Plastoroseomonas arctica]MBR0654060.1 ShlB/FhaC/HecB family hemolysin secretion/activation protein [Plastoroseomonas arctica]
MIVPSLRHAATLIAAAILLAAAPVRAQLGPRVFDTNRLDTRAPRLGERAPATPIAPAVVAEDREAGPFTRVEISGGGSLDALRVQGVVRPYLGRRLGREELQRLATEVGGQYEEGGLAIFALLVPRQGDDGVLRLQAVEGTVGDIVIQGDTEGADLSLIQAYAQRMAAERPLRRVTLERYLLLMNDIPGRRVIGRLDPMGGAAGAARLVLTVERINIVYGFGIDNLGNRSLGNVQGFVSLGLNALFGEGDSTRIGYGFPTDFRRFTFFTASHRAPIGTDGASVTVSANHLQTHETRRSSLEGEALTASVLFSYPVIRTADENLTVSAGLDVLETDQLLTGLIAAKEATRVLRAGATYSLSDGATRAGAVSLVVSQGLDIAGARQRLEFFYGDPSFTKATAVFAFNQALFDGTLVLRVRAAGQLTGERLPSSELFTVGGVQFGRAFSAGSIAGDTGYAGSLALALPLSFLPEAGSVVEVLRRSEIYGFVDYGRTLAHRPVPAPRGDRAASAGFGTNITVARNLFLTLEAARAIVEPRTVPGEGWRFVVAFRREI